MKFLINICNIKYSILKFVLGRYGNIPIEPDILINKIGLLNDPFRSHVDLMIYLPRGDNQRIGLYFNHIV